MATTTQIETTATASGPITLTGASTPESASVANSELLELKSAPITLEESAPIESASITEAEPVAKEATPAQPIPIILIAQKTRVAKYVVAKFAPEYEGNRRTPSSLTLSNLTDQ